MIIIISLGLLVSFKIFTKVVVFLLMNNKILTKTKNTQYRDDSRDDRVETKQCDNDNDDDKVRMEKSKNKKRKRRRDRFEMVKGFYVIVVNNIITQQEEIHNKLLEGMLKRDQERLSREEAWLVGSFLHIKLHDS